MSTGTKVGRKAADFISAKEALKPLKDRLLIKVLPLKLSETIHAEWKGNAVRGEVIAAGPGSYPKRYQTGKRDGKDFRTMRESTHFRPTEVRVGQIVELGGIEIDGYIFQRLYIDGQEHVLCQENDVAVVHE